MFFMIFLLTKIHTPRQLEIFYQDGLTIVKSEKPVPSITAKKLPLFIRETMSLLC